MSAVEYVVTIVLLLLGAALSIGVLGNVVESDLRSEATTSEGVLGQQVQAIHGAGDSDDEDSSGSGGGFGDWDD
ncbi:MAG: hypothetical protein ACOC46_00895 [Pirellulales bacterium]